MQYFEFNFKHSLEEYEIDVLMDTLGQIGFESFDLQPSLIKAYIPQNLLDEELLIKVLEDVKGNLSFEKVLLPDENWNAVWESQYEAVQFGEDCYIHAPFHTPLPNVKYNIMIEPKMSFGTAHHPTTSLIIEYLKDESKVEGKRVLDMGCGTGVLAILAYKKGAKYVEAIDNDQWAYENTKENIERNNTEDIHVELGDASNLKGKEFDVIIANINRNILLRDISTYAEAMPTGAIIFFSGFYQEDIAKIEKECNQNRLFYHTHKLRDNWAALEFVKK